MRVLRFFWLLFFVLFLSGFVLSTPHSLRATLPVDGYSSFVVSGSSGCVGDFDCDGVRDVVDNCPRAFNPGQSDYDGNGLGDVCDVSFESVVLSPSVVDAGRAVRVDVRVVNRRPEPVFNADLFLSVRGLGVKRAVLLGSLQPFEVKDASFVFVVPECVRPGAYLLDVALVLPSLRGSDRVLVTRSFDVRSFCDSYVNVSGDTVVDIRDVSDLVEGGSAVFPFVLRNDDVVDKLYVLSVRGLPSWVGFRVSPGSLVLVRAGSSVSGFVELFSDDVEVEGPLSFLFQVEDGVDVSQELLVVRVFRGASALTSFVLLGVFAFVLAFLFLFALFFLLRRR